MRKALTNVGAFVLEEPMKIECTVEELKQLKKRTSINGGSFRQQLFRTINHWILSEECCSTQILWRT